MLSTYEHLGAADGNEVLGPCEVVSRIGEAVVLAIAKVYIPTVAPSSLTSVVLGVSDGTRETLSVIVF